MVSLPDFLIRLYFPAEGTEIATGTSDAAAIGEESCRWIMCTLFILIYSAPQECSFEIFFVTAPQVCCDAKLKMKS